MSALPQEAVTQLEILVSFIEEGSGGPAPPEDIDRLERHLGRRLPLDLRRWLESVDGAVLAAGHLRIDPITSSGTVDDRTTTHASRIEALRASGWALPQELVPLGDDGADRVFAQWIPASGDGPNPVVAFRAPAPGAAPEFVIVGESFLAFLVGWAAAHAHLSHGAVYELLQVPGDLQRPVETILEGDAEGRIVDHEDRARDAGLLRFASPDVPQIEWPDEQAITLTGEGLRAAVAALPHRAAPHA